LSPSIEKYYSQHLGYVNLFPLFFGIIPPNSTELRALIDIISSNNHLWTNYGIRSLSKSDSFFQQGDRYWTEPIWIPMNYLLLRGLKIYYSTDPDANLLYETLRENLLKNMARTWDSTHNFWENYDSFTGNGKGFHSFTGWSSLFVLIYSEEY